jgi:heme/copper-type cytochrome/quinol oxidase subunit 2
MSTNHDKLLPTLGFLRVSLLGFALLNLLLPLLEALFQFTASAGEHSFWGVMTGVITPVMAPLLLVVILFDYIMSRVREADAEGEQRARFRKIGRIELAVMAICLLFWVPYFSLLLT